MRFKNILRFEGLECIPIFNISVDSWSLSQLSSSCNSFLLILSFSLNGHICVDKTIMQIAYFYLYSLWLSAKCPVAQLRTGDSWWFLLVLEPSCLQARLYVTRVKCILGFKENADNSRPISYWLHGKMIMFWEYWVI